MYRLCVLAFSAVCLTVTSVQAQGNVLAEFYGRGVHAYSNHDLIPAYDFLTKAIDNGIEDPRAYYFRGLTSIASGREYESESDFRTGAELEARGNFGPSIGQALTRIQGSQRALIEHARLQARLDHAIMLKAKSDTRYGDIESTEGDALGETPVPRSRPLPPTPPRENVDTMIDDSPVGKAEVESKDVLEGTDVDPFADDAVPVAPGADTPAAADPFGGDAPAGNDPFGADDPFGG